MRQVTATGQTVEDAVQSALEQLNTSKDQVNVEVIDEGKKGFFGIFGTKRAIVKVSIVEPEEEKDSEQQLEQTEPSDEHEANNQIQEQPTIPNHTKEEETDFSAGEEATKVVEPAQKHDSIEETKQYLIDVAAGMGATIDVKVHRNGKEVIFELIGSKIALLIGKRGQTLNALQYLAQLVINQRSDNYHTAIVDAEGYRGRRKDTLTNLANRLAEKAIRTNSDVALEAMPSYERKIIHTALQNHKNITTYSDGTEPHRHVVIRPE
ncbi:RNA-binding cell elongation regulator Jag/EloR [Pontibacillus yanchengensis]|uniref:RNA-binding protein KhpB n=1 Tax=Pontibacillus yanchengensis Y32 TaxID=1385514 RepID=A0A0A2TGI4_9BACI|nr:RNA-binding cell elongation regulator Jag/EloR [Pontibacillus yanchengensis]KGP73221.1 hypothetical protein N782_06925 [Pontibacillus yanchengensis Y32]